MTFLPIVERGLRVTARQRGTYLTRLIVVGALLAVWFFLSIAAPRSGTPVQRAHAVFNAITIVGLGFAMLAGIFLTADCLSEERREGTLGLLFLTDLKGYDVVLGKLVSTSVQALYGLLAGMPLLALPLLTGGMTVGEFWRMTLVLTVTLFLSLSAGLCVSALCREARAAMGATLLVMLVAAGMLPVLWWLRTLVPFVSRAFPSDWLLWLSPAYAYRYAFDVNYSGYFGAREFWISISVMTGLAVSFLAVAMLVLPSVWQERGRWGRTENSRSRSHRARFGSKSFRAARRWLLDANPFYWLATRDRQARRWASLLLFVLLPIWLCFYFATFSSRSTTQRVGFTVVILMAYGLHQFLKYWVAMEASRRFSEDRHSGALELLLITPLKPNAMLAAQRKAVWKAFAGPVFALAMLNTAIIWLALGPNPMGMGDDKWSFAWVNLGGIVLLVLDIHALTRVAMWTALTAKRHNRAILAALGRVMLPSWSPILFLVFLGMARVGISEDDMKAFLVLWFIFAAVVDVVNMAWAETKLRLGFRRTAAIGHASGGAEVARVSPGLAKQLIVYGLLPAMRRKSKRLCRSR